MPTCGCTGRCKSPPYTCGGFETQEEVESYLSSRWKILYKPETKTKKCPNCGCHLEEKPKLLLES